MGNTSKIKLFFTLLFLSISLSNAQNIKETDITNEDLSYILGAMGVEMKKIDLNKFQKNAYSYSIYVDEYENGVKLRRVRQTDAYPNKIILQPDEAKTLKKNKKYDIKGNTLCLNKSLGLYFIPDSKCDSLVYLSVNFVNGSSARFKLGLRRVIPGMKPIYSSRIFKFEEKTELVGDYPLMLYGSYWLAAPPSSYAFCGDSEIDLEMKNEIATKTPHSYVVGITVSETK